MHKLNQLQIDFQNYLLKKDNAISLEICEPIKGTIEERLSIYGNAYFYRLLESLEIDFPKCKLYLGEEKFSELMAGYLTKYPSKYYSVNLIGENLPKYIADEFEHDQKLMLAELAEVEWAMSEVYTAKGSKVLALADLQAIALENWPQLIFYLVPSLRVKNLSYNTFDVWIALDKGNSVPDVIHNNIATTWLLWRKHLSIHYMSLTQQELWVFSAILQKNNFEQICMKLCEYMPDEEAANYLVTLIGHWIQEELFTAF